MTKNIYNIKIGNSDNKVNVKQNASGKWLWDLTIFDNQIMIDLDIADAAIYKAIMISDKYNTPMEEPKEKKGVSPIPPLPKKRKTVVESNKNGTIGG